MPPQIVPYDLTAPEIAIYVRTEPIVRRPDYEFTVRANVHDALWMLTQQWRVGEFRGEDAGTVVKAKIETQTTFLNRFKSRNGPVEPLPTTVPLEAKVERLPIPLDFGFGLQIAQQWSRLLRDEGLGASYDSVFAMAHPIDTHLEGSPEQQSNTRTMQMRQALAGKLMDGIIFWNFIHTPNQHARDTDGVVPAHYAAINKAEDKLKAWFERVYYQPLIPTENSWSPTQLEYQFAVSVPDIPPPPSPPANPPLPQPSNPQTVFLADRYQLGKVDWYAVDVDTASGATLAELPPVSISDVPAIEKPYIETYLPHTIRFKGMPRGRWWEFEDQNIDLAKMMVQKQDIVKMVVLEFGIIYSNDWFVFPHRVNSGSVTAVNGLVTTDVFGRRFLVERAGKGIDNKWERWDMYNISKKNIDHITQETYNKLLLMPTVVNRQDGEPTEKVLFLRDEMANMAWGVEEIVGDELMGGKTGKKAADELQAYLLKDYIPPPPVGGYTANEAKLRYKITTYVPENWIPFVAAKVPNGDREIMLQRAAQFRYLDANSTPQRILPRTELLSRGLDMQPAQPYYINEEEISRSGFVLTSGFKRTRWYNGETFTWLGRKVTSGRGEGVSGLKFDMLEDKEADS